MKTTFAAVLYLPGHPARTLTPDQVHALKIGDLSMPGPLPVYHLCHGAWTVGSG